MQKRGTREWDGLAIDFVVEPDRARLGEIVQRVRDARLRTNIGTVANLDEAVAALNPTAWVTGKTIIRMRPLGPRRVRERSTTQVHRGSGPGSAEPALEKDPATA